jgi:hypothetical protein
MMRTITILYGEKDFKDRSAVLSYDINRDTHVVELFKEDVLVRTMNITMHTEDYAKDCAENWVIGVIKDEN